MLNSQKISKTGLGTGRLSSLGSSLTQSECNKLINTAYENNITVLDTADTYGSGDAERMIGKAISGRQTDFFIITKAGFPYVSLPGWMSPLNQICKKTLQKINNNKKFSKDYLLKALGKSLKRLNVDEVDAFVLHEPWFSEVSDESWEALNLIRSKGMARYTGVSTSDSKVIEAGIKSKQVEVVETPVFLLQKKPNELSISLICYEHNIPVIANQVLSGLNKLRTEKKDEMSTLLERYNLAENELAKTFISYASHTPGVISTLIGTKNTQHLVENSKIINRDSLTEFFSDIKKINL